MEDTKFDQSRDAYSIIKKILDFFELLGKFDNQFDSEIDKNIAFEKVRWQYYHEVKGIKKQLNGLYLTCDDGQLTRIKTELLRIRGAIKKFDFGFEDKVDFTGGEFMVVTSRIQPDTIKLLKDIKLTSIENLLQFIDDRIPLIETLLPQQKKTPTPKEESFEDCLTEEGKKLLPKLIKEYKNAKPLEMAYMIYSMTHLTTLIEDPITNISQLHKILAADFGRIGSEQSLGKHLRRLREGPLQHDYDKIDAHTGKIKSLQ